MISTSRSECLLYLNLFGVVVSFCIALMSYTDSMNDFVTLERNSFGSTGLWETIFTSKSIFRVGVNKESKENLSINKENKQLQTVV